jgi:prephenate dehydrogenase
LLIHTSANRPEQRVVQPEAHDQAVALISQLPVLEGAALLQAAAAAPKVIPP